jgi:cysteine desulfurase
MVKRPVYLDYHATTPVDPRVVQAMLPYFTERFGNPSSRTHRVGWEAAEAVDRARAEVARLVGARPREVVFTSGATESNNLAIKGAVAAGRRRGDHVVTVVTEHHAVLDACRRLERHGVRVTYLPVEPDGLVDLDRVRAAVGPGTVLVSVMTANNEIGVIQPVAEIARIAHARGALVHTDAAQAVGKIPVDVEALGVDLLSWTAHKMYGPKGVGALYIRRGVELEPLLDGGGQERGLRPGTLNVAGIVGFGAASAICRGELAAEAERLRALRDRLLTGLRARVGDLTVNGSLAARLPHNLNVSFPGVEGEALLLALGDDLAVSTGAACASGASEPSYVVTALGVPDATALVLLRFGLGRWTTADEIDYAVEKVGAAVTALRAGIGRAG